MPHYSDGTKAEVGDIIIGKPYNRKDDKGQLITTVGMLVEITPGSKTCNCKIAYIEKHLIPIEGDATMLHKLIYETGLPLTMLAVGGVVNPTSYPSEPVLLKTKIDYGEVQAFTLLYREGSKVEAPKELADA